MPDIQRINRSTIYPHEQFDYSKYEYSHYYDCVSSIQSFKQPFSIFDWIYSKIYSLFFRIKFYLDKPARFEKVTVGIYRGERPSKKGFDLLAQHHFRTVFNLSAQEEPQENIGRHHFNYLFFPIEPSELDRGEVVKLKNILKEATSSGESLYFYSAQNDGKVEFVTACIHILIDKWPLQKAFNQLGQGLHYYPALVSLFTHVSPINLAETLD
ncbi:MAG TPA: hypothetical protein VLG76_05280 [Rhabdochlamydiaceae bacterium]|nr:hypothetical protein [Rhabdochlamydiaceae bacterium]